MEEVALKITVEGGEKAQQSVKSIKQELREAKAAAAAAEEGTKEYLDAVSRAAVAADKLNDVNDAVKALNPGDKAAAFGTLFNTIAGGIQTITGLYGLFGDKSEEVEKILLRVQSAAALANGIQSLVEVQKQWALLKNVIMSATVVRKIDEASTKAATVTQKAFGRAVDTTTFSFKALKAAIVATGIGALVALIAELVFNTDEAVASMDKFLKKIGFLGTIVKYTPNIYTLGKAIQWLKGQFGDAEKAAGSLKDQVDKAMKSFDKMATGQANQEAALKRNIELRKAEGASISEVFKLEKELRDTQIANINKQLVVLKLIPKSVKDNSDKINTLEQQKLDLINQGVIAQANYTTAVAEELKKRKALAEEDKKLTQDEIDSANQQILDGISAFYQAQDDRNKAAREAQDKALEDQNKFFEQSLRQQADYSSKEQSLAEERTANAIATENAIREAKLAIAENTVNGLVALGQLFINDQKKLTKFNKVATLAGIALDTARAIASSIAGAAEAAKATGPGAPFALIAYITSGITAVLAGMAAAKKALQEPAINQVGGAAGGGGISGVGFSAPQIQGPEQQFNIPAQANDFVKVFVTETDITNTQQGVQNNKKKAILTL